MTRHIARLFLLLLVAMPGFSSELSIKDLKRTTCDEVDSATEKFRVFPETKFSTTVTDRPKGVALVVHGLNSKPSMMNSVILELNNMGIDVVRVSLSGHRGKFYEMTSVTREEWLFDLFRAYCHAKRDADRDNVPVYSVGFSLSGLLWVDLLEIKGSGSSTPLKLEKLVLLAPAISVHWYAHLIRFFNFFLTNNFAWASWSPERYRENEGTTVAAYTALFNSYSALQENECRYCRVPTLVFIDPNDNLVDYAGVSDWVVKNELDAFWKVIKINGQPEIEDSISHAIPDPKATGKTEWKRMFSLIQNHFKP